MNIQQSSSLEDYSNPKMLKSISGYLKTKDTRVEVEKTEMQRPYL